MTNPGLTEDTVHQPGLKRVTGSIDIYRLLSLVPLLFVLALFMGYLAVLLAYGQSLLRFPFDYDQGEGFELYDAIRLARGQSIYLDNAAFPFYSSNYPPVYRLILVPIIWLFGPHIWVGRIVAFGMTLVTGVFIYMAARRQMQSADSTEGLTYVVRIIGVAIPLVAALTFFAANYVYEIAPLARAHMPMVLFAFAGIYLLDRAFYRLGNQYIADNSRRSRIYAIAGITLLVIAGFIKLQAVDALAAGFLFLLLRKPRWFTVALVASAAVSFVAVVVLNAATSGHFWLNVVLANVNEYDIQRTWFYYGQWFQLEGVLIVCSIAYVVWDIIRSIRARSLTGITVWSLYFLSGSAMGMLTGKWGAGPTYLIAAIAASCVCTVGLVARTAELVSAKTAAGGNANNNHVPLTASAAALLSAGVFLWQATLNVHLPTSGRIMGKVADIIGVAGRSSYPPYPYYDSSGYTQLGHLLDSADTQGGWELVQIIRSVNGPVWSEEAMLTLNAGKDVVTNPTQLLNLSKSGMLDTTKMIAMIKQKAFGAAIFRAQFYPQDVMIAFSQNYHWVRAVRMNGFDYQVLYPNGK